MDARRRQSPLTTTPFQSHLPIIWSDIVLYAVTPLAPDTTLSFFLDTLLRSLSRLNCSIYTILAERHQSHGQD